MTRALPDRRRLQIVVWLPALCRKLDVPYCIVKVSRPPSPIHSSFAAEQVPSGRRCAQEDRDRAGHHHGRQGGRACPGQAGRGRQDQLQREVRRFVQVLHAVANADVPQRSASTGAAVSCRSAPRPASPSSRRPAPRSSPPATTPKRASRVPAFYSRMASTTRDTRRRQTAGKLMLARQNSTKIYREGRPSCARRRRSAAPPLNRKLQ